MNKIELTNEVFENEAFIKAVNSLYNNDDLPITTTYRISSFYKSLEQKNIIFSEVKDKLIERHSVQKDDTLVIPKEYVQIYTSELQKLLEEIFVIECDKVPADNNMKISAAAINLLEDLIDFSSITYDNTE